jgi:flagellin
LVSADGKFTDQSSAVLSSVASINLTTQTGANDALSVIDNAIAKIDAVRSGLGAVQNRFESTISNLQNVSENISAARSRILDADFAAETANLTKSQILQQAGVAMLSQANQLPQVALSLLQ